MARKSVISIDIGSCKTKIAVGSFEENKIHIEKAFIIDTPTDNFSDGRLLEAGSNAVGIGKLIVQALSDNKIKYKDVIFTIQSTAIIRRELEIPKVKPQELESMIRYEIEQYLPIDLDEYIIDYKVLEDKQNSKLRILIAALPKTIAENYLGLLSSINLEPKALDINSNAISKLFSYKQLINNNTYALDHTVALIDMGYSNINITIVSKGYFQFSRLIPTGGRELDTAIADMFSIPLQEAEKKKISEIDLAASMEGLEIIENIITRWTEDIQRVFQYYKTRNANNNIDKIYLYGGTSNLKGLTGYLENVMGMPTQKINTLDSIILEKSLSYAGIEYYLNSIGAIVRK